ncbi:hypothetical protein [Gordonia malaquae]|uniref:hypothetical protein n=1 Tax=Gordonia malaquae TaxID=410332 RepID=UPI0030FE11DA
MTVSAQDVLIGHSVRAMGSHRLGCMCGWESSHHRYADAIAEHAAHQAAALTAAGYAVVKLPEPEPDSRGRPSWTVPDIAGGAGGCVIHIDRGRIVPGHGTLNGSAREIAAALLAAAAAHAKAGERGE